MCFYVTKLFCTNYLAHCPVGASADCVGSHASGGSCTAVGFCADEQRAWRVRAYDTVGNYGAYSAARTLKMETRFSIYLPLVVLNWPPIPATPKLNTINNPNGCSDYTVSWSSTEYATLYILQESQNSSFSNAVQVYSDASTNTDLSDRGPTRYYYRVKAHNNYGDSGWSNGQSVDVLWEEEPNNDAPVQANGPLISGLT